jgi:putative copper export protein/mono/diheme cytochrome c family protein
MNLAFVAARAVHFGATMLLFGELVFASFVAGALWRTTLAAAPNPRGDLDRHVRASTAWALAASALSLIAWLVIQAADMAGTGLGQALARGTLVVVLGKTEFGHVFALRSVLALALLGALVWMRRPTRDQASRRSDVALGLAALYLATLAGAGHSAAATQPGVRALHIGADAFHLLAAGGWLGALPALVYCFGIAPSNAPLARVARRFSVLGIACVGMLTASGVVNALFLVGSFAALFGTPYGQLLMVKVAVFAALLVVAAVNRFRLTPRLAHEDAAARWSLRRNAMLEIAGGVVIVAIVGALGTMIPGAHESPVWPFGFTLQFSSKDLSPRAAATLWTSPLLALGAIAVIAVGVRRKRYRAWIPGCMALLASAVVSMSMLAVPAFPTTYAASPVPYNVDAVAHGASLFAQHCSRCHGAYGRGDGPAAASLAIKPANLDEHTLHHPEGNLFWWIAHGIPGTPMPAFDGELSRRATWDLVQFLVARASADAPIHGRPGIQAQRLVRVPDFTYEWPGQGQHALSTGTLPALIVLYAPGSEARLDELVADRRLPHAVRIVAIPLPPSNPSPGASPMHPILDPAVASVYAMFAIREGQRLSHTELLIDTAGTVRARWTGLPASGATRDAEIVRLARQARSASTASATMHHGH